MKPTIIPHPLKRICFNYNSDAALSNFEKKFIEKYKQLHDELADIKASLLELGPDIEMVLTGLKDVRKAFDKLDDKITRTELLLGISADDDMSPGEYIVRPGEIQNILDEFQSIRKDYWLIMVPMHNLFNDVYKRFIAFDDTVEQFEKKFSQPLSRNAETMEIDSRSFDQDMDEFRDAWMSITGLQDACLEQYNKWARRQTVLVNDSDALYERIKILFHYISEAQNCEADSMETRYGLN
jgi:hypothetical protein